MPGPKAPPTTRAGRPRRFEAEDELRILLDAALVVMERNGYADAAVADILREADLSTRSFYRHFESKDQLLCALFRREAEAAAARLQAKVDAAPHPRAALDAWIDEILSFGHHRAKAARVARARLARRHEGRRVTRRRCATPPDPDGAARGTARTRVRPTARSRWPTRRPTRR